MPYPNFRVHTFNNTYTIEGVPFKSEQKVKIGRTSWQGNQRRKKKKFNPPTAIVATTQDYNTGSYSRQVNDRGDTREGRVTFAYNNVRPVNTRIDAPDDQANIDGMARVARRFTAHAGMAETLKETPESLRLIARRTGSVISVLAKAGRGNFAGAAHALKEATGYNLSNRKINKLSREWGRKEKYDSRRATSFWLEANFGFVPLFQSIYDSVELFLEEEKNAHAATYKPKGDPSRSRYGLTAEVLNKDVHNLSRLGLTNPIQLAWDLLPFSFVIDWFLPISTILGWAGSRKGLGSVYSWQSFETESKNTVKGIWVDTTTVYHRKVKSNYSAFGDIMNASSRSFGLWQAVTSLSLVNSLR